MAFKRAVKSQSKLRAAMFGPSGAGKTYSALAIAPGMGGKIALIDSERSSASKYADRFIFDQQDLVEKTIDEYVEKINEAAAASYDVLIIDSLSHAWQMLLDSVEKLANAKYRGNTWSAWSEGTPEQRKLVNAIVSYPGHVIATMRSKTEWQAGTNDKGKTTPTRIGLAPEQGKGIEYEFDILFEISPEHLAHIIKDRTGKFQDKIIDKPGKEFGQKLVAWLNEGTAPPPPPPKSIDQQCRDEMVEIGNILTSTTETGERYFTLDEYNAVKAKLKSLLKNPPESRLALISQVLEEQKDLLVERISFFENSGAGENPGEEGPGEAAVPEPPPPPVPAKPVKKVPAREQGNPDIPAMYAEPEPEEEAREDDGFIDDIPWKEDSRPKKPSRRTSGKFPEPAAAELDIY
jgi:hypothetical protein